MAIREGFAERRRAAADDAPLRRVARGSASPPAAQSFVAIDEENVLSSLIDRSAREALRQSMGRRKSYRVTFERDESGWVATAPDLTGCHARGRSISQARARLRRAMALHQVPRSAPLDEKIRVRGKLDADLEALRAMREEAERLAAKSAEQTRRVALRLAKAGLSRRDVGELLGLSFQRAQQLIRRGPR